MESPVEYSDFIQPICLPSNSQSVKDVEGIVAGYGIPGYDKNPTQIPYKISLVTDDLLQCFARYPNSGQVLSLKSFCANNSAGVLCMGK